ncbi:MAG: OmcA/MtrC family decaheme c-type cytochrome [Pseudomonadales bacterium]|nr:OmcA/MtrC family decaheme c-type cytochrome [Pseudomonadales bacterium]
MVGRCVRILCLIFFQVWLLSGCSDGDDGAAGPAGPPGIPGKPATEPEALSVEFSAASVDAQGRLVVTFDARDEAGWPYPYLAANQVRFSVVKLLPPGDLGAGESSAWQSYINRIESAPDTPVNGPGVEDQVQATTEASGQLTNLGDGSYEYAFVTNLKSVTEPLPVTFDASKTHRVAIQVSGGVPVANATFDWIPDTGESENIPSRSMVSTETCNQCHGNLALHGGGRVDVDYCVTCHNPGSSDANSGHSVDFKVMIHKIHRGAGLPSVAAGGEYAIWGFRDSKHDYSHVQFPQDVRNCTNCHSEQNPATPDAGQWQTFPTVEACGSCHDDVNFTTGEGHIAGARDNSECSTCHTGSADNQLTVANVHNIKGLELAQRQVAISFERGKLDPADNSLQVLFALINPESGEVYRPGAADLDFIGRARIYHNSYEDDTGYQDANTYVDVTALTPDGTGLYTMDTDRVVDSGSRVTLSTRLRVCADEKLGSLLECSNETSENVGAVSATANLDASGNLLPETQKLVMGAQYERCETCHADPTLSIHGGDYSTLEQCRACHNNAFLRSRGNLDLKFVVHAYHANNLDDGDGGKEAVHYPDTIGNCSQCHDAAQINLPLTANTGAALTQENGYTSPTAFVCASCHLSVQPGNIDTGNLSTLTDPDQALVGHMIQNGAVFNGSSAQANITESCSVCHGSGSLAAIDEAHQDL